MMPRFPSWFMAPALVGASLGLAACQPAAKAEKDGPAALLEAGYSPTPVITSVTSEASDSLLISGQARPDGRVRFLYGQQRAVGVTADSKGHFVAELPVNPQGSVFDVSMEDSGRLMHAEGRLFVPPGQPSKAVMMRPGSPSLPVAATPGIFAVDYDAAGALAIAGRVAPKTHVRLTIDGVGIDRTSDAGGYFTAVMQIAAPGDSAMPIALSVDAGGSVWQRNVTVTRAAAGSDQVTPIAEGWRVDWVLPGGGMQTTLVF